MKNLLILGAMAGVTRALLFSLGAYWISETADWRQLLGYYFALLGLPEMLLTRGLRSQPLVWGAVSAILVAVGTVAWTAILVRIVAGAARKWR